MVLISTEENRSDSSASDFPMWILGPIIAGIVLLSIPILVLCYKIRRRKAQSRLERDKYYYSNSYLYLSKHKQGIKTKTKSDLELGQANQGSRPFSSQRKSLQEGINQNSQQNIQVSKFQQSVNGNLTPIESLDQHLELGNVQGFEIDPGMS